MTTARARELRRDSSRAEKICWHLLRDRRINGAKFRRQHPIGPYLADFACISQRLVIEIDGEHHAYQVEGDARRTAMMENLGWRVIRFWANEVVANPEGIWAAIEQVTRKSVTPSPNLSPSGGEEYERRCSSSNLP
jgi:very-short-patch-repair endonuclease